VRARRAGACRASPRARERSRKKRRGARDRPHRSPTKSLQRAGSPRSIARLHMRRKECSRSAIRVEERSRSHVCAPSPERPLAWPARQRRETSRRRADAILLRIEQSTAGFAGALPGPPLQQTALPGRSRYLPASVKTFP
jgi:hypothetical protein